MSTFAPADSSIGSRVVYKRARSLLMPDSAQLFDPKYSTRRLRPRRQRPSVTSIAEMFITSLVVAGFCPKHSPRLRSFDTEHKRSSECKGSDSRICSLGFHAQTLLKSRFTFLTPATTTKHRNLSQPRRAYFTNAVAKKGPIFKEYDTADSKKETVNPVGEDWLGCTSDESLRSPAHQHDGQDGPSSVSQQDNGQISNSIDHSGDQDEIYRDISQAQIPQMLEEAKEVNSATLNDFTSESKNRSNEPATEESYDPPSRTSLADSKTDVPPTTSRNSEKEDLVSSIHDETRSNQYVFRLYRELPSPGITHLSYNDRMALLRRFAKPRDRRWVNARRYLALVRDMIAANLPLPLSMWTSAIYLTGHATGRVFKSDLRAALGIWQRMEHVEGIKSDGVVFATLFDIAIKSGQFMVADRLLQEMSRRGIGFSRCGMVSHIYYFGCKADVDGIRKTFDEFVNSGQLVDTVVLNCLLVAFLRSGELDTAEQIYNHMMDAQRALREAFHNGNDHPHHPSLSEDFFAYRKKNRDIREYLNRAASLKHSSPAEHKVLQAAIPLTPDTRTFHIFLSHHSRKTGDFDKFMDVLRDIENTYVEPPRAMTFLFLFEGFARHGGQSKTQWTTQKLFRTWEDFRRALYDSKKKYNERFHLRHEISGWENSLAKQAESRKTRTISDMYRQLPSKDAFAGRRNLKRKSGLLNELEREDEYGDEDLEDFIGGEEMGNDLEDPFRTSADLEHELQQIERRLENGVFLGRRIIITILRAFGTCSDSQVLMEVWLQIERIWLARPRRTADVLAVREELNRQLQRGR